MNIDTAQENGKFTIAVEGKLDTITAQQFQDVLIPAFDEAKEVILNLSKVDYVSSAGLRVFLLGQKTAKAKGAFMAVTGVSEEVMDVFKMTGFDNMITIL